MKFLTAAIGSLGLALGMAGCAHNDQVMPVDTPVPEAPLTPTDVPTAVPTASPTVTPVPSDGAALPLHYVVRQGDSLWIIAARPDVLGNSMLWPLLYRANRDDIVDPDIIEVDQNLAYEPKNADADIQKALGEAAATAPYVPHTEARRNLDLN